MTKRLSILFLSASLLTSLSVYSQSKSYPVIGEAMPEFTLNDVHHFSKNHFDNSDLKGKWVIMDFWSVGCSACVKSFPKINELQKEFDNQIQFLLVGQNDKKYNSNIEKVYERYRKAFDLELPIAYDSTLFTQFGIRGVPHVIVIDPDAKVYAVTYGEFLSKENIRSLVANEGSFFKKKRSTHEPSQSGSAEQWKYWINPDEQRDFEYRSIFSEYNNERIMRAYHVDRYVNQGLVQATGITLYDLYNLAYFGKSRWHRYDPMYLDHWSTPVLEIDEPLQFESNYSDGTGYYNYSATVPYEKSSRDRLMEVMQGDLKNYFGYDVSFETRLMPYWRFTATEKARKNLRSTSENLEDERGPTGLNCKRISIGLVLSLVEEYNADEGIPFIDETNIKFLIDIELNAVMTDLPQMIKELKKQGLILEKSKKEMKVLVIRDSEPEMNN